MIHNKFPSAVTREFEIDSEETMVFQECESNETTLLLGWNVMFIRCPGVENLMLASMKMTNFPGSHQAPLLTSPTLGQPWGLTW